MKILYECEYCGAKFSSKNDAEACEAKHVKTEAYEKEKAARRSFIEDAIKEFEKEYNEKYYKGNVPCNCSKASKSSEYYGELLKELFGL